MENRKYLLSIGETREMDMMDYLSRLGYEPVNQEHRLLVQLPIADRIPSFKINPNLNRWYDPGLGNGENIIDFGILYHHCTVSEFLQKLRGNLSFQPPLIPCSKEKETLREASNICATAIYRAARATKS